MRLEIVHQSEFKKFRKPVLVWLIYWPIGHRTRNVIFVQTNLPSCQTEENVRLVKILI